MDLDEILPSIGEFGKYQKLVIWFILCPAVFPCGFHAYNQLFMATVPEHWCKIPAVRGIDPELVKNMSIPIEITLDNKSKYSECLMYDLHYDMINFDRPDMKRLSTDDVVPCKNGWDYRIDNIRDSVVSEWNLVCANDFAPTLALVLFGCSGLVGNYIFGYIQDGFGRKPAYFIYLLIQCVFGVATALANNFVVWVIFRIGVGFTIPAILGTPYVLAIELVGPKHRTAVTILINIAYSLSLVSLSVVVWAVRSWRWMALATTVPFTALFFTWFLLPESPRWLLAQMRYEEAEKILRSMARINGKSLPPDAIPKAPKKARTTLKDTNQPNYGIRHLFWSPNLRWKTIIITFLWFTNTSVYVGLSYYAPALGGDEFLNFFLAGAVELPTYLFLWPAMERLGRRWTLCISMVIGGSSCLATFLVQNDYNITLTLYCVGKMGISSSFVVLPLMASELYPTVVRGLGMSLSSVVGMLGPIFIPLVNYLGSDMTILPLIIMGTMLVAGGLCSLLLPETLNEHLPQTLADAEKTKLDFFACCIPPQREENVKRNNIDFECAGSDMTILPLIIMGTMLVAGGLCSLLLPETLNEHLPQTLADAEKTKLDFFACCIPPQREETVKRNNIDFECAGSDMTILPLIIMGTMLVAGGLCSLLLPETLNEHLPQTLADAEKTRLDFFACCIPPQREENVKRNNIDFECAVID